MAVAASPVAVTVSARGVFVAALAILLTPSAPQAQSARCDPALPVLHSDNGRTFMATGYGVARWQTRTHDGRHLPYAAHVWKGKAGLRRAYLTFEEIPGTSGPNYHLDTAIRRAPGRIDWQAQRRFAFDPKFVIYSGPFAGEWTIANCLAR